MEDAIYTERDFHACKIQELFVFDNVIPELIGDLWKPSNAGKQWSTLFTRIGSRYYVEKLLKVSKSFLVLKTEIFQTYRMWKWIIL